MNTSNTGDTEQLTFTNLAQLIEDTFEKQLKNSKIDSTKIIKNALDKCSEADVNCENEDGYTPLEVANSYLNPIYHESIIHTVLNVIELLLCSGAKKDEIDIWDMYCTAKDRSRDDLANMLL